MFKLLESGVPLKDGAASGDGAYTQVAEDRNMTVDQVRRGYTAYRGWQKAVADSFAEDAGRNK